MLHLSKTKFLLFLIGKKKVLTFAIPILTFNSSLPVLAGGWFVLSGQSDQVREVREQDVMPRDLVEEIARLRAEVRRLRG